MSMLYRQVLDEDDCKQTSDVGSTSSTPAGKMEVETTKTIETSRLVNIHQKTAKKQDSMKTDADDEIYKAEDFTKLLLTILENTQTGPSENDFLSSIEPFEGVDAENFDFPYDESDKQQRVPKKKVKKENKQKRSSSVEKRKKSKQRKRRREKKSKKSSKTPKRVKAKTIPRTSRHVSKNAEITDENIEDIAKDFTYVKTSGASNIGRSELKFKQRAGFDPFFSQKDVPLEHLGKNGGVYVKQDVRRYGYNDWGEAIRDQTSEWKWDIWLDPSAAANIIHPPHPIASDSCKVVEECPTKVDLGKEFGKDVEFVYMSPPWDTPCHGYGKRGYFTVEHLKKTDLSFQTRGFVFMWVDWYHIIAIINIMKEKGYFYADSSTAMLSTWQDGLDLGRRTKNGKSPLERMSGGGMHGVLFKKKSKQSFRI